MDKRRIKTIFSLIIVSKVILLWYLNVYADVYCIWDVTYDSKYKYTEIGGMSGPFDDAYGGYVWVASATIYYDVVIKSKTEHAGYPIEPSYPYNKSDIFTIDTGDVLTKKETFMYYYTMDPEDIPDKYSFWVFDYLDTPTPVYEKYPTMLEQDAFPIPDPPEDPTAPEPSTVLLIGIGVIGMGYAKRRKNQPEA